ncbi:unnamed protein product [Ectocarpus sp. 4 AP-2014]
MSLNTGVEPWSNPPPSSSCAKNKSVLLKARWRTGTGPPPSQGWDEVHGDSSLPRTCDGWESGNFSSGTVLTVLCCTTAERRKTDGRWRGKENIHPIRIEPRANNHQGKRSSHPGLAIGPLQVSSVALRPFAHGELYRRPPQRLAGRKPLMAPGAALSSSLAPIEPHGFDPRLLDKEALCIGSGISRGASLTSQGAALRQKQLQFRRRAYQSTHKSAGLVRLISIMREDASSVATTGGGRDSGSRCSSRHRQRQ